MQRRPCVPCSIHLQPGKSEYAENFRVIIKAKLEPITTNAAVLIANLHTLTKSLSFHLNYHYCQPCFL